MSLLASKRTYSQFEADCARSARADQNQEDFHDSLFPLQSFRERRCIPVGRSLGQQGVVLVGKTPRPGYKSEIIVKIDQPLARLKILFPKMSEHTIHCVMDRTSDLDEAIRALAALSLNPTDGDLNSEDDNHSVEIDHVLQQRTPPSPSSSSEVDLSDHHQQSQFLDPEFYVTELVKLGVEDTFLRQAFYRFKQETDGVAKRDKDKLLKLLGKQRKDNILLKKLLNVQLEKEKVGVDNVKKYKEVSHRNSELEGEVTRRGEVIWKLQREREELLRALGGGNCGGKPMMSRLPDVC